MSDQDETQTDAATEPVPADNAEPQIGEIGTDEGDSDEAGEDEEADGDEDTGVTDAA